MAKKSDGFVRCSNTDGKTIRAHNKAVKHAESQLQKDAKQEKKDHPWATKKQAMKIAKDHKKKGK